MKIEYDFRSGTVRFESGEPYNIESLRRYTLNYHPDRLKDYYIRCVKWGGKNIFTYDFDGFFETVDINFLRQYKMYLASCYDDHVFPVSGISPTESCLESIYRAVQAQFVIDEHDFKLLQGRLDRADGRGTQYPLMVFVGVADMHGFKGSQIMDEAQLESTEHLNFLINEFKSQIQEGVKSPNRIYIKTVLVLNALRYKYENYVELGDIGDI